MTCALGAAELLAAQADWSGTAEFILQPAEEIVAGARQMIADGLWELIPPAEIVFGQHVWPIAVGDMFYIYCLSFFTNLEYARNRVGETFIRQYRNL